MKLNRIFAAAALALGLASPAAAQFAGSHVPMTPERLLKGYGGIAFDYNRNFYGYRNPTTGALTSFSTFAALFADRNGSAITSKKYVYNKAGIMVLVPANTPALGYEAYVDDYGQPIPKGVVIEAAQTQILTNPSNFAGADWTKTGVGLTPNSAKSPMNLDEASTITEDGTTGYHGLSKSVTKAASAVTYASSCYFLPGSGTRIAGIEADDGAGNGVRLVAPIDGTSDTNRPKPAGFGDSPFDKNFFAGFLDIAGRLPDGSVYYKLTVSYQTNTTTTIRVRPSMVRDDGAFTYAGNGTSSMVVWGCNTNTGSVGTSQTAVLPTSYIDTNMTRVVDMVVMDLPPGTASADKYSGYVDARLPQAFNGLNNTLISLNNADGSQRIAMYQGPVSVSNAFYIQSLNGSSTTSLGLIGPYDAFDQNLSFTFRAEPKQADASQNFMFATSGQTKRGLANMVYPVDKPTKLRIGSWIGTGTATNTANIGIRAVWIAPQFISLRQIDNILYNGAVVNPDKNVPPNYFTSDMLPDYPVIRLSGTPDTENDPPDVFLNWPINYGYAQDMSRQPTGDGSIASFSYDHATGRISVTTNGKHGIRRASRLVLQGFTPSAYNTMYKATDGDTNAKTFVASPINPTTGDPAPFASNPGTPSVVGSMYYQQRAKYWWLQWQNRCTTCPGDFATFNYNHAAGTVSATTLHPHALRAGNTFTVTRFAPAAYNVTYTATAGTDSEGKVINATPVVPFVTDPGPTTAQGAIKAGGIVNPQVVANSFASPFIKIGDNVAALNFTTYKKADAAFSAQTLYTMGYPEYAVGCAPGTPNCASCPATQIWCGWHDPLVDAGITEIQTYDYLTGSAASPSNDTTASRSAKFFNDTAPTCTFLSALSYDNGTKRITATTTKPHGLVAPDSNGNKGSVFTLTNTAPSAYSITYTAVEGTTGSTIVAAPTATPFASDPGVVTAPGNLPCVQPNNQVTGTDKAVLPDEKLVEMPLADGIYCDCERGDDALASQVRIQIEQASKIVHNQTAAPGRTFTFNMVTDSILGSAQDGGFCGNNTLNSLSYNSTTGQITGVTAINHGIVPGGVFTLQGTTPAAYSTTYTANAGTGDGNSTTLRRIVATPNVALPSSPGAATKFGFVSTGGKIKPNCDETNLGAIVNAVDSFGIAVGRPPPTGYTYKSGMIKLFETVGPVLNGHLIFQAQQGKYPGGMTRLDSQDARNFITSNPAIGKITLSPAFGAPGGDACRLFNQNICTMTNILCLKDGKACP